MTSTTGKLVAIHYNDGPTGPARLEFETPLGKVEWTTTDATLKGLQFATPYTISVTAAPDANPVPTPGG